LVESKIDFIYIEGIGIGKILLLLLVLESDEIRILVENLKEAVAIGNLLLNLNSTHKAEEKYGLVN